MATRSPLVNPETHYDAVMLCSYGGPRKTADVLPFMRNATEGRGVPDSRLLQVSGHYGQFAGISPINGRTLELREALEKQLRHLGCDLEVVVGNRNWTPFFHDTLCDLAMRGKTRVLCVFTSAYVCYSGCRQYREDLAKAQNMLAEQGLKVTLDKVRPYYTTEGFVQANLDSVLKALQRLCPQSALKTDTGFQIRDEDERKLRNATKQKTPGQEGELPGGQDQPCSLDLPHLAFVTHSIPQAMQECSGPANKGRPDYARQHLDVCEELVARLSTILGQQISWDLSYCSRSGPPHIPWLEPDINDSLKKYHQRGIKQVIAVPIGFICDHMEVVFDLDTEAKQSAEELGLEYLRAETAGTAKPFVQALAQLIWERTQEVDQGLAVVPGPSSPSETENNQNRKGALCPDALKPTWPAWPGPDDSLVSQKGEKLPVICEQSI